MCIAARCPRADQESAKHPLSKVASDPIGPLVMVELSSHSVTWLAAGVAENAKVSEVWGVPVNEELTFFTKNLGFTVSQNAIHRLRSRWGAPSTAAARSVATLYNAAHVCILCTQFFCSEVDRAQGPEAGLK